VRALNERANGRPGSSQPPCRGTKRYRWVYQDSGGARWRWRFEHARHVARNQVHLEVHARTGLQILQGRVLHRVRDQVRFTVRLTPFTVIEPL